MDQLADITGSIGEYTLQNVFRFFLNNRHDNIKT